MAAKFFDNIKNGIFSDVCIDLGTVSVLVYVKGRGIAGDYQSDERAGVARLSWRVSFR